MRLSCLRVNVGFEKDIVLIIVFEWNSFNDGDEFGAPLTDLSKPFDCNGHLFLLAKLYGYEVSLVSLKLIVSHFERRTQRIKINNCFTKPSKIDYGIP